jgi:hypothetical protein
MAISGSADWAHDPPDSIWRCSSNSGQVIFPTRYEHLPLAREERLTHVLGPIKECHNDRESICSLPSISAN